MLAKNFFRFVTALLILSATHPSWGATLLWTGDQSANWSTDNVGDTNWDTNTVPANADTLRFGVAGASGTVLTNDLTALSVAGLIFNAGASSYTIGGNALTLTGAVTNSSSVLQTIDVDLALGANSTIAATSGALTFSKLISTSTATLGLSGTQTINFTGGLNFTDTTNTAGVGTLSSTAADVRFNSAATFKSDVSVSGGGSMKFQSGTQTFDNGFSVTGSGTVVSVEGANVVVNGIGGGGSLQPDSLYIDGGATVNVSSGSLNLVNSRLWMQTGTISISGGTVTMNNALVAQSQLANSFINVSGGSLTVGNAVRFANNGNATLTVSGTGAVQWNAVSFQTNANDRGTAVLVVNGGTFTTGTSGSGLFAIANAASSTGSDGDGSNTTFGAANRIDLNGGVLKTGGLTSAAVNPGGAILNFNGGTLQAGASNATFIPDSPTSLTSKVQAGGAVIDSNGFTITIADALEHDAALGATVDGGLTKNGAAALTLSGANTYTGTTTVNAGTLAFANNTGGTVTYVGQVAGQGGAITLSGANMLIFSGGYSLTNTASTLTSTATDARITGNGTYGAVVSATGGTLSFQTGTQAFNANVSALGGTIKFQSGSQTFATRIFASGASSVLSFEGATAIATGTGDGSSTAGLLLDNGATMNVSAGSVTFNGTNRAFIQTSTINVTGGSLNLQNALVAQASGTITTNINVSGGSLTLGSSVRFANNGTANLTVSGTGAVTWAVGSFGLSENGRAAVTVNGGTLTMTGIFALNGGNSAGTNTSAFTSYIALNGGVVAASGFSMNTNVASGSERLAELRFNGGTLRATASSASYIPISTKLLSQVQVGGAVIDTNTFNITIADVLEHDSTLGSANDGGLTKTGAGVLTLTAANTYNGKTSVQVGTLTLSGTGNIVNSHWLDVSGGATFNAGGSYTFDRTISGTGTVQAGTGNTFTVGTNGGAGFISPGTSSNAISVATAGDGIGTLNVNGNLTLTGATVATTRLSLQLGDANSIVYNDGVNILNNYGTLNAYLANSASTYEGESGVHDRISITGNLNLDAGGIIALTSLGYQLKFGDVLDLMDWATAGTAANLNADGAGGSFVISASGGDLVLPTLTGNLEYNLSLFGTHGIIVVVPEPSRALLLLAGLVCVGMRRRRKN